MQREGLEYSPLCMLNRCCSSDALVVVEQVCWFTPEVCLVFARKPSSQSVCWFVANEQAYDRAA